MIQAWACCRGREGAEGKKERQRVTGSEPWCGMGPRTGTNAQHVSYHRSVHRYHSMGMPQHASQGYTWQCYHHSSPKAHSIIVTAVTAICEQREVSPVLHSMIECTHSHRLTVTSACHEVAFSIQDRCSDISTCTSTACAAKLHRRRRPGCLNDPIITLTSNCSAVTAPLVSYYCNEMMRWCSCSSVPSGQSNVSGTVV